MALVMALALPVMAQEEAMPDLTQAAQELQEAANALPDSVKVNLEVEGLDDLAAQLKDVDPEQAALAYQQAAVAPLKAAMLAVFGFVLPFWLIVYVYTAVCLMQIAKKTGTGNRWMAWIPIFSTYLMVKSAGKPGWWLILMLVPLINIVIGIICWMAIAKRLNKPEWLGVLFIIPIANFILMGYLAFTKDEAAITPAPPSAPATV